MATTTIGGNILGAAVVSVALTPTQVNANTTVEQSFTVSGIKLGDYVELSPPGVTAGIVTAEVRVSAANTIAISFTNVTGGALTPAAGNYQVLVIRPETVSSTFSM